MAQARMIIASKLHTRVQTTAPDPCEDEDFGIESLSPMSGPVPSRLIFLSDLPRRSPGDKVRFLGWFETSDKIHKFRNY